MILRIEGEPALVFYLPGFSAPALTGVAAPYFQSTGTLRRSLGGENANISVTLDNSRGQLTARFAVPPLRARAELYLDGQTEPVFAGSVAEIGIDAAITVNLEA